MEPRSSWCRNTNPTPSPMLCSMEAPRSVEAGPGGPGRHPQHGRHRRAHEQGLRQVGPGGAGEAQDQPAQGRAQHHGQLHGGTAPGGGVLVRLQRHQLGAQGLGGRPDTGPAHPARPWTTSTRQAARGSRTQIRTRAARAHQQGGAAALTMATQIQTLVMGWQVYQHHPGPPVPGPHRPGGGGAVPGPGPHRRPRRRPHGPAPPDPAGPGRPAAGRRPAAGPEPGRGCPGRPGPSTPSRPWRAWAGPSTGPPPRP